MFDLERLYESALVAQIEQHDELDSTNNRALLLAAEPTTSLPLLVLTQRQTAGRGRGTNTWWAGAGSLTFSLVIDTAAYAIPQQAWPQLSLVTGLSLCDALEPLAPLAPFALKWPNDIYAAERKVGGILIEAPPANKTRLVIGIGINVNNSLAAAPPELRQRATSLVDLRTDLSTRGAIPSETLDLTTVLLALLTSLDSHYRQLANHGFASLLPHGQSRCFLTGRTITVLAGEQTTRGECLGLAPDGALLLKTSSGILSLVAGSVLDWDGNPASGNAR